MKRHVNCIYFLHYFLVFNLIHKSLANGKIIFMHKNDGYFNEKTIHYFFVFNLIHKANGEIIFMHKNDGYFNEKTIKILHKRTYKNDLHV
jgi:hypothetical protein